VIGMKREWWIVAAGFVGLSMAVLGVGNMLADDPGPLYGKVTAAVVGVGLCAVIFSGIAMRSRRPARGSHLVGFGVLPAAVLVMFVWFPPVALIGLLAIVVAVRAISGGGKFASTAGLGASAD